MSMSNTKKTIKDIHRCHRRLATEEKILIALDGHWDESSVAELCRKEGISQFALPLEQPDLTLLELARNVINTLKNMHCMLTVTSISFRIICGNSANYSSSARLITKTERKLL